MRFNDALVLCFYLPLLLTGASPSPVYDISSPSSHYPVLQARGGCLSCNRPPTPSSYTSKPHAPSNLGRLSLDRPLDEAAARGFTSTFNGCPPAAAPRPPEPLGGASSYSPSGNLPMSDRWMRRLDRLHHIDPNFKHDDSARSSRWSSGASIVPRAPQGIFGRRKYSDPHAFAPGNGKIFPGAGP